MLPPPVCIEVLSVHGGQEIPLWSEWVSECVRSHEEQTGTEPSFWAMPALLCQRRGQNVMESWDGERDEETGDQRDARGRRGHTLSIWHELRKQSCSINCCSLLQQFDWRPSQLGLMSHDVFSSCCVILLKSTSLSCAYEQEHALITLCCQGLCFCHIWEICDSWAISLIGWRPGRVQNMISAVYQRTLAVYSCDVGLYLLNMNIKTLNYLKRGKLRLDYVLK